VPQRATKPLARATNPQSRLFVAPGDMPMAKHMRPAARCARERSRPKRSVRQKQAEREAKGKTVMRFPRSAPAVGPVTAVPGPAPICPANDDDRGAFAPVRFRRPETQRSPVSNVTVRNQLMLAFLIWAGILPPVAGGLSDYLEDDMLGLMMRSALRASLSLPGR
jgi:hypothetical protein